MILRKVFIDLTHNSRNSMIKLHLNFILLKNMFIQSNKSDFSINYYTYRCFK